MDECDSVAINKVWQGNGCPNKIRTQLTKRCRRKRMDEQDSDENKKVWQERIMIWRKKGGENEKLGGRFANVGKFLYLCCRVI